MNVYLPSTDVNLSIPFLDDSGNPLMASAVSWRVIDQTGLELQALQPLAGFVSGESVANIIVPAALNTLAATVTRDLRQIELTLTINGNKTALSYGYIIGAADALLVGVNSFMTYTQAEYTAQLMPALDNWNASTEQQRIAALAEARSHIVQLSFTPLNSNVNWGQDSLNFIPEGTYNTDYIGNSNMFLFNGNLDLLRPDQFKALPTRFLSALYHAQVAEADNILGGNTLESKRQAGLIQDNIGESRQTYRNSKPLTLPCSRRALAYLGYFVTFSKRIGRM